MTDHIKEMLADAYRHLGVTKPKENDRLVKAAVNYLLNDREHYMEIAEEDQPEYLISSKQGIICKTVPLARSVITDETSTYREVFTATLYLVVTTGKADYVHAYTRDKLYDDPAKNTHTHPFYRYTRLSERIDSLTPMLPEQIVPIATLQDWEIFRMAFAVYAKFCKGFHINFIPQQTEQAMGYIRYAPDETFTVITGRFPARQFLWSTPSLSRNPYSKTGASAFIKGCICCLQTVFPAICCRQTASACTFRKSHLET